MGIGEVSLRLAVFLDRDGVLNRNVLDAATGEYGAPLSVEKIELVPGVIRGLLRLRDAGFLLFVVSNQPNYAKGKSSLEELAAIHEQLKSELDMAGVEIAEFYYCYHHPRGVVEGYSGPCDCRKPSPYFLFKARDAYGLDLDASWMIGDRATDIECGRAAGVRTIRVAEDHPAERKRREVEAEFEAKDITAAVEVILAMLHSEVSAAR
jgi:D-glycero-D-manno-heptose 1,7-bisphosphate phosphatase